MGPSRRNPVIRPVRAVARTIEQGAATDDPATDERNHRRGECERHGHGFGAPEMIEQFLADGGIHSRYRVNADADVELFHGFPERIELGMIEGARADGPRDHDADRGL